MSDDGADLGVTAGRALKSVLGGDPQPSESERMSMAEMEKQIRSRPLPLEGEPPWGRDDVKDAYSYASECIAHAFLVCADEDPEVLTRELYYPDDYEAEILRGKQKEANTAVWEAMKERWPGADEWLGGATGFMVGWAYNAARCIKELPPAPNPAIVTVGGES